jgi:hypothetical protein
MRATKVIDRSVSHAEKTKARVLADFVTGCHIAVGGFMMSGLVVGALWVGALIVGPTVSAAEPTLDEISASAVVAWQGRNDVEVPNDGSASRFALDTLTGDGPWVTGRVELSGQWRERQEWRVLVAPLALSETGTSTTDISFQGASFVSGPIDARYQFNSWRLTWRYLWIDRADLRVKVGFTAKVRDASIRLRQGSLVASKNDTGFVPLLHAVVEKSLGDRWLLEADIDALGGGPGYAVDLGAGFSYALSDHWRVRGQLRFLDGGADNDKVYAFARFSSFNLGVVWRPR